VNWGNGAWKVIEDDFLNVRNQESGESKGIRSQETSGVGNFGKKRIVEMVN